MTCRESPGNQPSYVKIHTAQLVKQDKGLSRKKVSKGGVGDMLTLESLKVAMGYTEVSSIHIWKDYPLAPWKIKSLKKELKHCLYSGLYSHLIAATLRIGNLNVQEHTLR